MIYVLRYVCYPVRSRSLDLDCFVPFDFLDRTWTGVPLDGSGAFKIKRNIF